MTTEWCSPPPDPAFHVFMEASRLTALELPGFAARLEAFDADLGSISIFDQPAEATPLPVVDDKFQELLAERRSDRVFNDVPLSLASVSSILAAVGVAETGGPVVPSAGGLDPLGLYAFMANVDDPSINGTVQRYVHRDHQLGPVTAMPDEVTCRRLFSLDCEGSPALLLGFAIDPAPTMAKYGERGGRFLLQHVGHAMQNVGLRLAWSQQRRAGLSRSQRGTKAQRLHGYILGGVSDELLDVVGLSHTRALMVGGYAIGAS